MPSPLSKGRMIRSDIKKSKSFASLSKESKILFLMMIPHFSSHGKMNGSPYYVKGEIVPLLEEFTIPIIEKCLLEISNKTNVKWFEYCGLMYLHSINWEQHQELRKDRMGKDDMPDYSCTTPVLCQLEVEVEVKGEVKGKGTSKDMRLSDFEIFWNTFAYKQGKGGAEKAWLSIKNYSSELFRLIIEGAKKEAARRPTLINQGKTPKWAQGWITERRWEDEVFVSTSSKPNEHQPPQESDEIKQARQRKLAQYDN